MIAHTYYEKRHTPWLIPSFVWSAAAAIGYGGIMRSIQHGFLAFSIAGLLICLIQLRKSPNVG